jgi:hypothetical protein
MREYDRVDDENGFKAGCVVVAIIAGVMYTLIALMIYWS